MLANANSPTDASSLDRNVREVVAICATHDLAHGEPNDLVTFMRALHEDKHLAMNFWSLVARLTDKGGPHPNQPDWILATIVEGVTGRGLDEVRAVGPAHRVLVSRLASMLAGEDVQSPVPAISTPAAEPPKAAEELIPARQARQAEIAEITPRQSRTSAALASVRKSSEAPPIAPITNPAWLREERLRDERLRLVLEPERPLGAEEAQSFSGPTLPETPESEPHVVIPLSSYADASREPALSGGRLAAGLVLLLLIASGVWLALNRNSPGVQKLEATLSSGYQSTMASLKGNKTQAASNRAATVIPVPETSAVATPPAAPASTPSPTSPARSRSARTAEPSQPQAVPVPAPVVRRPPNNEALVAAEASSPDDSLPESSADRVAVPAATMQDNLISSRVPIFPEAAKADGIEGRVVLQAIVNKDGSVGHLHVISGDPALRRAATEAVSTWRYRPYLVNGQPVEVSTTITVDFFDSN